MTNRGLRRFTNRCAFGLLLGITSETGRYVDAVFVCVWFRNSLSIEFCICAVNISRATGRWRGYINDGGAIAAATATEQLRRRIHRVSVRGYQPAIPAKITAMVWPVDRSDGRMDPRFLRQDVAYDGREAPGTIVIDTPNHFLYLVQPEGRAIRYGIGVGRPGFTWSGHHSVSAKKEWPDWTPPDEMIKRQPYLPHFVAGGPNNPLGARAMYLGSTLYRIHGSNEPWTIGRNVSSGCIRMRNADIIDLYERVKVGTKVVVL